MPDLLSDDKIKPIAFYLPQFHQIPENDAAWEDGFTEWTNVRKAAPFFDWHYQPRVPLNDNYYCLLDEETQLWQAELAKKYDVYGFCYYHYWFGGGRQLLEKPSKNMLTNKSITTPFVFSWANESWARRWVGGYNEMLVEQKYGGEAAWRAHFDYLLPFFMDERYITADGKPLFIIYRPENVPQLKEMLDMFQTWAKENGLPGLCIMAQFADYYYQYINGVTSGELMDYIIRFEPLAASHARSAIVYRGWNKARKILTRTPLGIRHYDEIWRNILRRKYDPKVIQGAFTGWDNTSRHGRGGLIVKGSTPDKFYKYTSALISKLRKNKALPVIFVTAWNEWGEGCYLEPDEKFGYGYLEALKKAVDET